MSQLVLEIPETLHQQLERLARDEGVSLSQYLLFALTRQATSAYTVKSVSKKDIDEQKNDFAKILQSLGQASFEEIEQIMQERELTKPEKGLSPEVVQKLQNKINQQRATN